MSPFATDALKNGFQFIGGKSDDITVIVAKIVNRKIENEIVETDL